MVHCPVFTKVVPSCRVNKRPSQQNSRFWAGERCCISLSYFGRNALCSFIHSFIWSFSKYPWSLSHGPGFVLASGNIARTKSSPLHSQSTCSSWRSTLCLGRTSINPRSFLFYLEEPALGKQHAGCASHLHTSQLGWGSQSSGSSIGRKGGLFLSVLYNEVRVLFEQNDQPVYQENEQQFSQKWDFSALNRQRSNQRSALIISF